MNLTVLVPEADREPMPARVEVVSFMDGDGARWLRIPLAWQASAGLCVGSSTYRVFRETWRAECRQRAAWARADDLLRGLCASCLRRRLVLDDEPEGGAA